MELINVYPLWCNTILFQGTENVLHGSIHCRRSIDVPPAEVEFDDLYSHRTTLIL